MRKFSDFLDIPPKMRKNRGKGIVKFRITTGKMITAGDMRKNRQQHNEGMRAKENRR